jgi:Flp pilus assembly protein TadD
MDKATRSDQSPDALREQAVALLSAGRAKEYRDLCAKMVKKFGRDEDAAARRAVADACVLAPDAADCKALLPAAEAAVKADPRDVAERARLAALLLRAGEAKKAVEVLEKVVQESTAGPGEVWLLVLALQRAGDKDRAEQWQQKAGNVAAGEGQPWSRRQAAALWRREAEAAE